MKNRIEKYADFWPFYLSQHRQWKTKQWHVYGTVFSLLWASYCIIDRRPLWLPLSLLPGYGMAWYSHFFIEKNKPATWQYPVWSLISDFRMAYLFFKGQLPKE